MNERNFQGVNLTPKFIFGVNGQIKNSLYRVDDNKLAYIAGHNVVIYNQEDKSQQFVAGTEGVQAIVAVTVSSKVPLMAICERTDTKARCTIFNLTSRMKVRVIPEVEHEADFKSNVFYGAAFCPKDPARYIVTLCGEPDWVVHLWQHDIFKPHCRIEIGAQPGNTF